MGQKLPKRAKKAKKQILQSYITAQFVQYGKIRVKYDYTNTPYDTSLIYTVLVIIFCESYILCDANKSIFTSKQQAFARPLAS